MISLCAFTREIVRSRFPKDLPEKELKKQMFIAYYKNDFKCLLLTIKMTSLLKNLING